jgi:hypothetical protein
MVWERTRPRTAVKNQVSQRFACGDEIRFARRVRAKNTRNWQQPHPTRRFENVLPLLRFLARRKRKHLLTPERLPIPHRKRCNHFVKFSRQKSDKNSTEPKTTLQT